MFEQIFLGACRQTIISYQQILCVNGICAGLIQRYGIGMRTIQKIINRYMKEVGECYQLLMVGLPVLRLITGNGRTCNIDALCNKLL